MKLLEEVGVKGLGKDVFRRAVEKAIDQYWQNKAGDPVRFLQFITEQKWHETPAPTDALQRCPVPARREGTEDIIWVEARTTYFGEEFGNNCLAEVFRGMNVMWAVPSDSMPAETQRDVLTWLGVAECPHVDTVSGEKSFYEMRKNYEDYTEYLNRATGCRTWVIGGIGKLAHVILEKLDSKQATCLIRLLAKNWSGYYRSKNETRAQGTRSRSRYSWTVNALWWYEVCAKLKPPIVSSFSEQVPLEKCWLPDVRTARSIGELLPVINIDAFEEDKETVRQWLETALRLRTQIEKLTPGEWTQILSERIPQIAPADKAASDEQVRRKVTVWYGACLEVWSDTPPDNTGMFHSCPLLCRKGKEWKYVNSDRYLDNDRELSDAFGDDVWLLSVPANLMSVASKYFGIRLLSTSAEKTSCIPSQRDELPEELSKALKATLPYIYAERLHRSKECREKPDKLKEQLESLQFSVASELQSKVKLSGIEKNIPNHFIIDGSKIILRKENCGETAVAQAIAQLLGVSSDADFYENLLRCKNGDERKAKLRDRGLTEADIERAGDLAGGPPVLKPTVGTPLTPSQPTDPPGVAQNGAIPTSVAPALKPPTPPPPLPPPVPPEPPERLRQREEPLELVNPETVHYEVEPNPPQTSGGSGGSGGGGGGSVAGQQLSGEQKRSIEDCGRTIARRELEKMGYAVESMSPDNPGFDLRARKAPSKELRVEVKSHLGRAVVVDLTMREYQEYWHSEKGGYDWQLWNIEHLKSGSTPTITKYTEIPPEALDAKTFKVKLGQCSTA